MKTPAEWKTLFESSAFARQTNYSGPLGPEYNPSGTRLRLWAPTAQSVSVNLYRRGDGGACMGSLPLERQGQGLWSVYLPGDQHGRYYTFTVEVEGTQYETGDPYARTAGVNGLRSMILDAPRIDPPDWSHDHRPAIPASRRTVWEVSVRDFSQDPASGVRTGWRGKFMAFTQKGTTLSSAGTFPTCLDYLKRLGVGYVQLMPIFDFGSVDESRPLTRQYNWGYDPTNYNVPEGSYSTDPSKGEVRVRECKEMIAALHAAGIGVVMDVVYNHMYHNENPLNSTVPYYFFRQNPDGSFSNGSGCGNEFASERPMARKYLIDSVLYWAQEYHIDGFRFDLAATLARLDGEFTRYHPFLYALRSDLLLGNLKMIMEPWDCGPNGWRTGQLGIHFAEWNDRFRDCTRTFWLTDVERARGGETGDMTMQSMATRLCGSADLFATDPGRGSTASVNYVACHDGFTTADLTQYRHKHNEANGENNRDGSDNNHSVNFGHEGPCSDPIITQQRERAIMNMLGTLLLSLGTPMLLAGDEFGNSQNGNNNAYTQDNETTWLDWDWLYSTEQTAELKLFNLTSRLIALRKARDLYNHEDFFTRLSKIGLLKKSDRVHWFLPNGKTPHDADWTNPSVRSFAMQLLSPDEPSLLILVNGSDENVRFHLPNDIEWEMIWSSAEIAGEYPGQGTQIEKLAEFDEEAEDKPAGRFRNHLQRLNTMYWQMDENADSLNSADDGLSEDDPTLWTLPALSISAMKQISTD